MQRLKERQSVLVMVGERMAVCTLAGFSDGAAVLVLTERQRGGPMPDFSPDAQLTFEYGPNLVMLNGTLQPVEGELRVRGPLVAARCCVRPVIDDLARLDAAVRDMALERLHAQDPGALMADHTGVEDPPLVVREHDVPRMHGAKAHEPSMLTGRQAARGAFVHHPSHHAC